MRSSPEWTNEWNGKWVHHKKDDTYEVLGKGHFLDKGPMRGTPMVAYRNLETGEIWFRSEENFDGIVIENCMALKRFKPKNKGEEEQ